MQQGDAKILFALFIAGVFLASMLFMLLRF
jgi:hypothetical protein